LQEVDDNNGVGHIFFATVSQGVDDNNASSSLKNDGERANLFRVCSLDDPVGLEVLEFCPMRIA